MIFERVNFNEAVVREMTAEEFEASHLGILWQDRDEETRKKMLKQVYELIHKPDKKAKKKSAE